MPGGGTGEKCTTELGTGSCAWENGWDFRTQSLMREYDNMKGFP